MPYLYQSDSEGQLAPIRLPVLSELVFKNQIISALVFPEQFAFLENCRTRSFLFKVLHAYCWVSLVDAFIYLFVNFNVLQRHK